MTSGTISVGPSPTGNMPAYSYGHRKTWSGGNGKYESYAGTKRSKWNNYTLERIVKYVGPIAFKGRWQNQDDDWANFNVGVQQTNPGGSATWRSQDELSLQQKLLTQVKGHSFNLAVAAGEGKKTVDMAVGTLTKLGQSVRALKHGDVSTAARLLGASPPLRPWVPKTPGGTKSARPPKANREIGSGDLASRWLELQYGWKPLLSDVYESAQAYRHITKGPRKKSFTTAGKRIVNHKVSFRPYKAFSQTVVRRTISFEMYEEMTAPRQLGLLDPLSLGWELLPFSFVVDWFVPIGTYLDNLAQIPKLRGRFLTSTFNQWAGYQYSWDPDAYWPNPVGSSEPKAIEVSEYPSCNAKFITISRVVSTSLSPPLPLSFDSSGLRGNRIWNAIALTRATFVESLLKSQVRRISR